MRTDLIKAYLNGEWLWVKVVGVAKVQLHDTPLNAGMRIGDVFEIGDIEEE